MKLLDFFERLKVEVDLRPLTSDQLEHFAYLTQRTAEFHLTAIARSVEELKELQESDGAQCLTIEVRDRFGNYGVAGGVIFNVESGVMNLDTFLMNCRVMGKKVEYITLQKLAVMARERNCERIRLQYRFTPRNAPAAKFVKEMGAQWIETEPDGLIAMLPIEIIDRLAMPVDSDAQPVVQSNGNGTHPLMDFLAAKCLAYDAKSKSQLLTTIGTSFQSADQILEAVNSYKHRARLLEEEFAAPRTEIEQTIAASWQKLLNVEEIGIYDNFFELGGHSLLATQAISRLRETFKVELGLRRLFESPTVASLARSLESAIRDGQGLPSPPITRVSRDMDLPLSFGQQRLWFLEKLSSSNSPYKIIEALRLEGPLNIALLENSINEIVKRHESLRTTFPMVNGKPVQAIAPSLTLTIHVIEVQGATESERRSAALQLMIEQSRLPFDLAEGPLLRINLLRIDEEDHIALVVMHHIISDAWSIAVLVREMVALYKASLEGQSIHLSELPIQYADFAHWQRSWLDGEVLERYVDHWKQKLSGLPPLLELPADHSRPSVQTFRGTQQSFLLPKALSDSFKSLSEKEGVTLFMGLLSAFKSLLHYYTERDDMVVGVDVANRTRSETEGLIGFFVNQLVLRTDLSHDPTFKELLNRVRDVALEAYAYQDLPFDKLVEALNPQRDLSRNPLFQIMFGLQNVPMSALELPGVQLSGVELPVTEAVFDLTLYMADTADGLVGSLRYNADLFEATTISKMAKLFEALLENVVATPDITLSELEAALSLFEKQNKIEQQKQAEAVSFRKLKSIKRKVVNV